MGKVLLFIKHNCLFLWSLIESVNGLLFSLLYKSRLKSIQAVRTKDKVGIEYRALEGVDIEALADFFDRQPQSYLEFFHPHGFDVKSLLKQYRNRAFLMYGCFDCDRLVGYFFLRCFFIGKAFRGKIVDYSYQGMGIGTTACLFMTDICGRLGIRQFATVSKQNTASLASSKSANIIVSTKELADGYICVEYGSKAVE